MPSSERTGDSPEQFLAGADRARPLPAELRARLEDVLLGDLEDVDWGEEALVSTPKPIPTGTRGKLETSLSTAGGRRRARKWGRWVPAAAAAAAVVVAVGVSVPDPMHRAPASNYSASKPVNGTLFHQSLARHSVRRSPSASSGMPAKHARSASASRTTSTGAFASSRGRPPDYAPSTGGQPVLAGLRPAGGPSGGGNWVLVSGTVPKGTVSVVFGEVPAARVIVVSQDELRVLSPRHQPGTVNVVVKVGRKVSALSPADRYTYK